MTVYFVEDTHGRVKIGHTADLNSRLFSLRSSAAGELCLIRVVDGGVAVEKWFHKKFAVHHIRGEWFWFVQEMLTVAAPDELPVRRKITPIPNPSPEQVLAAAETLGLLDDPHLRRSITALAHWPRRGAVQ